MSSRLEALSRDANDPLIPKLDLLPVAFKELGIAAQELEASANALRQQQDKLRTTQAIVAAERQRYCDLFESTADSYIVTDLKGIIQEANRAATLLLERTVEELVGKALTDFLNEESRLHFNYNLAQKHQTINKQVYPLQVNFCLPNRRTLNLDISYTPICNEQQIAGLRWVLRNKKLQVPGKSSARNVEDISQHNRPKDRYYKGEVIPINHQEIYQVYQGVVKLTTMSDTGEEVLVGLMSASMPFGTSITGLNVYQATALTNNVELAHFSLAEMLNSPYTIQKLIPKLTARLRQAELLLYISGQRRVKHRLFYLLDFLKQEIGQPVPLGTRLSVRFTHEEIASACCATRVTTTRQLNKMKLQGLISIDDDHHIILLK